MELKLVYCVCIASEKKRRVLLKELVSTGHQSRSNTFHFCTEKWWGRSANKWHIFHLYQIKLLNFRNGMLGLNMTKRGAMK